MKAPHVDELPAFVDQVEEQVEAMRAESSQRFAEMQKMARAECEKSGLDYDKVVLEQQAKSGGPPRFTAARQMQELRGEAAYARSHGVAVPELEAKLEDPAFFASPREEREDAARSATGSSRTT